MVPRDYGSYLTLKVDSQQTVFIQTSRSHKIKRNAKSRRKKRNSEGPVYPLEAPNALKHGQENARRGVYIPSCSEFLSDSGDGHAGRTRVPAYLKRKCEQKEARHLGEEPPDFVPRGHRYEARKPHRIQLFRAESGSKCVRETARRFLPVRLRFQRKEIIIRKKNRITKQARRSLERDPLDRMWRGGPFLWYGD